MMDYPEDIFNFCAQRCFGLSKLNGQRIITTSPIQCVLKHTEVFVGRLDPLVFEDTIFPIFEQAGLIYQMRLLLHFSGRNRTFCFVKYFTKEDAKRAVEMFHNTLLGRNCIVVYKSSDNCRLYIGGIPKHIPMQTLDVFFRDKFSGIKFIEYHDPVTAAERNRGYVHIEFFDHRQASKSCCKHLYFGQEFLKVDWAVPEPDVSEEVMRQVKVLYINNMYLEDSKLDLCYFLNTIMQGRSVGVIAKVRHLAYVSFDTRELAEQCLEQLSIWAFKGRKLNATFAVPREYLYPKVDVAKGVFPPNLSKAVPDYMLYEIKKYKKLLGKPKRQ